MWALKRRFCPWTRPPWRPRRVRSREGGLVAFPTETVYGLGADATNPAAIARLYQAKGRPSFNPLIAHVFDLEAARRIGRFDAPALRLAEAFWPGPLTLVLPKTTGLSRSPISPPPASTPSRSVFPRTRWRGKSCSAFGGAVVAPSANLSGHVSPTTARPCAKRPRGADRSHRRWRPGRGRRRIHHRRMLRSPDAAAAGRRAARRRSSACSAIR